MSSFFTTPASQRKRKRNESEGAGAGAGSKKRTSTSRAASARKQRDESISGSESESERSQISEDPEDEEGSSGSEHENETAAERRLRLAERYLDNIREEVDEAGFDAEQIDRDLIAERLREDVAESKGQLYRHIASDLSFETASRTLFRADTLTSTSTAACPPYIYTVSKDLTLIKWKLPLPFADEPQKSKSEPQSLNRRRRPKQIKFVKGQKHPPDPAKFQGHTAQILTVAASLDGKYVVTGGMDRRLIVWDAGELKPLKVFMQHRDAVTALAFRRGTNTLFSASRDRTIKVWGLDELAYVETLFGHQDEVTDIAGMGAQERCLSVGARDRTARLWKIVDETQLVFRGGGGGGGGGGRKEDGARGERPRPRARGYAEHSIDCVASIDTGTFVTGSSAGTIALWQISKKKPMFSVHLAHGLDPPPSLEDSFAGATPPSPHMVKNGVASGHGGASDNADLPSSLVPPQPRWITALATVPFSDLVLSGSWDGSVRAWKVSADKRRLDALGEVSPPSPIPPTNNDDATAQRSATASPGGIRGVINSLQAFPLSDMYPQSISHGPGADGLPSTSSASHGGNGVVVVAAVGAEHKFGRWMPKAKTKGWKNGAVVFTVLEKTKEGAKDEGVDGASSEGL